MWFFFYSVIFILSHLFDVPYPSRFSHFTLTSITPLRCLFHCILATVQTGGSQFNKITHLNNIYILNRPISTIENSVDKEVSVENWTISISKYFAYIFEASWYRHLNIITPLIMEIFNDEFIELSKHIYVVCLVVCIIKIQNSPIYSCIMCT